MTSTPAYGFRINKGATGPMQTAMQAGDTASIQKLLTARFPGLKFESLDASMEEVEKPEGTTTPVATAAFEGGVEEAPKQETTASLFEDYMASLPTVARPLVTTDYKGVRGGRLGEGNYTTASMIPGAQVTTPAPAAAAPAAAAAAPAAAATPSYTTYNYYNFPQETQQDMTAPVADTSTAVSPVPDTASTERGMTPAWAKTSAQQGTTTKQASAGLVPSTTQKGVYVAPTAPEASRAAAGAAQRVESAVAAGQGLGVRAAAGSDQKMGVQAAAAVIAAPGSDRKAAERALNQAEKGNIELTNNARKALEQVANKKK